MARLCWTEGPRRCCSRWCWTLELGVGHPDVGLLWWERFWTLGAIPRARGSSRGVCAINRVSLHCDEPCRAVLVAF
eukprot:3941891-Rhodomonas_salina.1